MQPWANVEIEIDERTDSSGVVDEIRWELQFKSTSNENLFWMSGHVEIENYVDSNFTMSKVKMIFIL